MHRLRWLAGLAAPTGSAVLAWLVAFHTDVLLSELEVGPLGAEAVADGWVERVSQIHGSRSAWLAQGEVELTARGELPFLPTRPIFGLPLSASEVELVLAFRPDEHGPYCYTLRYGGEERSGTVDTRGERDGLGLLLDSVRHLFEVPFSSPVVPLRRGLPPAADGLRGIFVTWGSDPHPTQAYDQVALWERAGRLVRMDTTGRDIAPFILARVDYAGEVGLGSLRLPRSAIVRHADGRRVVHQWELLHARRVVPAGGVSPRRGGSPPVGSAPCLRPAGGDP